MSKIDLHGYKVKEALEAFTAFYNDQLARGDRSEIEVVHGYGSSGEGGEIRKRLHARLERHRKQLSYVPGERRSPYNPGVTFVKPLDPLPGAEDALQQDILIYCQQARTESKILNKFRSAGDRQVKEALQSLLKADLLERVQIKSYPAYQSRA